MTHPSAPELLVLHAVRITGFAGSETIAARAKQGIQNTERILRDAERTGWVQHMGFADLDGWSLTDDGKSENERQLAAERQLVDPGNRIQRIYREFLPLNARLVRAVTDWQLKPSDADLFVPNDHSDADWDTRVLGELATLSRDLAPLTEELSSVLARFDGYSARYDAALRRAVNGEGDWVDKTDRDSCHRVWFQLHEDLVATLGIDRSKESAPGDG